MSYRTLNGKGPVHFNRPLTRLDVWGDDVHWVTAQICIGDIPEAHKNRAKIQSEIDELREEYRDLASRSWLTTLAEYRRVRSVPWEIETLETQLPGGERHTIGSDSQKDRGFDEDEVRHRRSGRHRRLRHPVDDWETAVMQMSVVRHNLFLAIPDAAAVNAGRRKEIMSPKKQKDAGLVLMQALQNGDRERAVSALRSILERDLQLKDEHARIALHYAAWRGYHHIVEHLLDEVHVRIADHLGKQAFHLAAARGHRKTIKLLLKHIDQHRPCANGQTWLHHAVLGGSLPVVELILTSFHAINHQDLEGRTALHSAVLTRHSELVKLLLSKGANQSLKDATGRTVLHLAAMSGDLNDEVVGHFLGTAALNVADRCGRMPLHYAAERGFASLATVLQGGTDLDLQDSTGDTALHLASRNELAMALVKHGADIWMEDWDNATPVMMAAENGHHGATTVLAECMLKSSSMPDGMASDLLSRYKLTLHDAARYECPMLAETLLRSGADIHKRDASGMTALSLAVHRREEGIVDILLGAYADVYWDLARWVTPGVAGGAPPVDDVRRLANFDKRFERQMHWNLHRFDSAVDDVFEARFVAQGNDDVRSI
ncbi:hypothetical protein CNMCM5623_007544 [Aspergillus felis]|uniref:Ankyrin repeat protein n=1 Tax=Aspergillus felis TaxID=1287682 RepID=A0A8H6QL34_9EURO|nr:hypothetical protein CNMCM5623_007544 [Aspergillus felis]